MKNSRKFVLSLLIIVAVTAMGATIGAFCPNAFKQFVAGALVAAAIETMSNIFDLHRTVRLVIGVPLMMLLGAALGACIPEILIFGIILAV